MDSKHRHELEQNDLMDFVAHFTDWWEKYGTTVLIVVLAVAAVVFAKRFLDQRSATRHENAWADLAGATSPEGYQHVASDYTDPIVTTLANLRGADLLVRDAAVPEPAAGAKGHAGAATQPTPEAIKIKLDTAEGMYQKVLARTDVPQLYHLNAMLGLGAVAENRGNWKDAEDWYGKVADQAGPYVMIGAQAAARRAMLPELRQKLVFATSQPAPAPATQPSTFDTFAP